MGRIIQLTRTTEELLKAWTNNVFHHHIKHFSRNVPQKRSWLKEEQNSAPMTMRYQHSAQMISLFAFDCIVYLRRKGTSIKKKSRRNLKYWWCAKKTLKCRWKCRCESGVKWNGLIMVNPNENAMAEPKGPCFATFFSQASDSKQKCRDLREKTIN